jgi:hypothetical protein
MDGLPRNSWKMMLALVTRARPAVMIKERSTCGRGFQVLVTLNCLLQSVSSKRVLTPGPAMPGSPRAVAAGIEQFATSNTILDEFR